MSLVLKTVGAMILAALAIFVGAVIGGTILWLLWPGVMVSAFRLPQLTWGQSVGLTWVVWILLAGARATTKSKD